MLNDGSNFSYQNIIYAMKGKKNYSIYRKFDEEKYIIFVR